MLAAIDLDPSTITSLTVLAATVLGGTYAVMVRLAKREADIDLLKRRVSNLEDDKDRRDSREGIVPLRKRDSDKIA